MHCKAFEMNFAVTYGPVFTFQVSVYMFPRGYFYLIARVYTRVKIIGWSGHTIQNYDSFVIYVIFVCICE